MSNVKAGDLAIIRCEAPRYNGRIVEVISLAPRESFLLPDGTWHIAPFAHLSWVIRFIGGPSRVSVMNGAERDALYAVSIDSALFPLPGDPEPVDEREEAEA